MKNSLPKTQQQVQSQKQKELKSSLSTAKDDIQAPPKQTAKVRQKDIPQVVQEAEVSAVHEITIVEETAGNFVAAPVVTSESLPTNEVCVSGEETVVHEDVGKAVVSESIEIEREVIFHEESETGGEGFVIEKGGSCIVCRQKGP